MFFGGMGEEEGMGGGNKNQGNTENTHKAGIGHGKMRDFLINLQKHC